tara:strand:- start:43 stop:399 length:357 start_codon:yes stop_codon:yes gene_type:complete
MGRPRKVVTDATTKPKSTYIKKVYAAQEPSQVETLEQQVEQLTELLTSSIEAQLESYQVSVDAEDKFKALVKITAHSLNMMLYHCEKVEQNTGSLSSEDVKYSVNLLKRTIEHNFKKD